MPRDSSLNERLLERSFTEAMLTRRPMNVLLGIIAFTGTIVAAICGYGLSRRIQARRREEDQAAVEAEVRREAENLELVIKQLDALHTQTGFNISASRAEIQKTLEQLRRTDPSADR
jgi:flagellar biosynthesis/type III secretory pathway M-ring protein FliF/YscJ